MDWLELHNENVESQAKLLHRYELIPNVNQIILKLFGYNIKLVTMAARIEAIKLLHWFYNGTRSG